MAFSWNQVEKGQKAQYINFVFYDESKLEDLRQLHIPFCWIKHDKDFTFEDEGDERKEKKAHFHVLIDYGNSTTINHWKNLLSGIPANDYAEITASPRGYFRYMIHADDPNKYQYAESDRHEECGFSEYELLSKTDTNYVIKWVDNYIRENDLYDYVDVLELLDENGLFCEYMIVVRNTIHFESLLKSRRCRRSARLKKEMAENAERLRKIIEEEKKSL